MRRKSYDKYDRYWSTGMLLSTPITDRWTMEERIKADIQERSMIFRRFYFHDNGKARIFIKRCSDPKIATKKVARHNKIVDFVSRLDKILNKIRATSR